MNTSRWRSASRADHRFAISPSTTASRARNGLAERWSSASSPLVVWLCLVFLI